MFKLHKFVYILLMISLCCANETEYSDNVEKSWDIDPNSVVVSGDLEQAINTSHSTGFKWAWEMQQYQDVYTNLRSAPWIEAANVFELSTSFEHRREHDDQDNYTFVGYASFRPFVLDYGAYSVALGVSYIARFLQISDFDPKIVNVNIGGINAAATVEQLKTEAYQQSLNVSALLSVPESRFQMIVDIGYGFSNFRETADPISANVGGINLVLDEYQYQQRDEGVFGAINFLKTFDRDYLNYVRLFVYGAYRLKTTKRSSNASLFVNGAPVGGKRDLEIPVNLGGGIVLDLDPQLVDESYFSFVSYQLYLRLFTIHTPLSEDRGIAVHFFHQTAYTSFELLGENFHGFQFKWGTQITLFEGIGLRAAYVDEEGTRNNDRVEGFEFQVSVQVSGLIRALFTE